MKADKGEDLREISSTVGDDFYQYYDTVAGSTTVVFLHGAMNSKDWARELIGELRGDYRCIALDLPGHNGIPIARYSETNQMAAYVWNLLEFLSVQNVVLLGFSFGGVVAYSIERQYRGESRLKGLVVWSSPLEYESGLTREGKMLISGGARLPFRLLRTVKKEGVIHRVTKAVNISLSDNFIKEVSHFPVEQSRVVSRILSEVRFDGNPSVASLFVYDPEDKIVSMGNLNYLRKNANARCTFVSIESGGHFGTHEGWNRSFGEIRKFIKGLEST